MYFNSEEQAIAFVQQSFPGYDLQELVAAIVADYAAETEDDDDPCAWWDGGLTDDDLHDWVEGLLAA